ncbi:hypothetical protein Riv7116_4086 [Rivularia sp. PCC 7116]|uniref:hypothetical protein n=1 Tax=Rivularia sp. PCC 7116 TaxID=373994 RepID=UPI00029F357B|nr:hypothetical protein [Rivularia sp. PCC 7116]AFY56522.1 hypothetical protein Riv7116_4086 [Rivularia sp. PCC 7116]
MSEDLTKQWLTEIQSLKQQIAQLQTEQVATRESAEKWRKLYNTEAEQRRTDSQLFRQTVASLKAEIQKLQGIEDATLPDSDTATAIQQEIAQLSSTEELKTKLTVALKERDRLLQALKTEQDKHSQTRQSLTTALGDAIDGLKRQKTVNSEQ